MPVVEMPQHVLSSLFEEVQSLQNHWGGQCVRFVNKVLGTAIKGNAWDWQPNLNFPLVGAIVLFKNHVAVVVGIIGDALVLAESNYSLDERIDIGRTVKITDPSIRGYLLPHAVVTTSS